MTASPSLVLTNAEAVAAAVARVALDHENDALHERRRDASHPTPWATSQSTFPAEAVKMPRIK